MTSNKPFLSITNFAQSSWGKMIRQGSKIQAKLIEEVDADHWIVSFQGQLLQVKNTTAIEFKPGLRLQLIVMQSDPLELKIHSQADPRNFRLNVRV